MIHYPNMIMIAGSGKNVGKTWLSCRIIEHLSKLCNVTAVKTSPHLHTLSNADKIIAQSEHYALIDEQRITKKDSSLMLQAGAVKSYFFQYQKTNNPGFFDLLRPILPDNHPVVCESASIINSIKPEVSIFIKGKETSSKSFDYGIVTAHQFIINPDEVATFDVKIFSFENEKINVSAP